MHPENSLDAKDKGQEHAMAEACQDEEVIEEAEQSLDMKTNNRLRLKADIFVLPLMSFASMLAFLDKNALGYAAIFGIKDDLNLKGQEYSWLSGILYFGYMIAQVPLGYVLVKLPLGKLVGGLLLAWGICIVGVTGAHNFAGMAAIRFLLGFFEAGIVPCQILMTGLWYRREEQALRTAIWYNTLPGVLGGIFAYAIYRLDTPLQPWKLLFLIYGSVTIGIGLLYTFATPDNPDRAWFYSAEEKKLKKIRTAVNQTGQNNKNEFRWSQIFEALRELKFWVIVVYVLIFQICNAGVTNFNPLIIAGLGFGPEKTALLAGPQAGVATIGQISFAAIAVYVRNVRCLLWALSCMFGLLGAVLVHVMDPKVNQGAALAGVYLMGFYNVSWVLVMSLIASNNAGATKKSFASTSFSVLYAVGNIYGPQLFIESQAPRYPLGIFSMMVSFAVQALCAGAYFLCCLYENKSRDRKYGKPEHLAETGMDVAEQDLTDGQNKNFRYCL